MRHSLCNTLCLYEFGKKGRSLVKGLSLKGEARVSQPQTQYFNHRGTSSYSNLDIMRILLCALVSLPVIFSESGMAELKAITGDEPYNGFGNAPAPMPRPMGFWGRPRMSPMGYGGSPYGPGMGGGYGMGGMGGGYGMGGRMGYGSPMDRFTSFSSSPYEDNGPTMGRYNRPQPSLLGLFGSFIDGAGSPLDDLLGDSPRGGPSSFNPSRGGPSPFSARGVNTGITGPRPDFSRSQPSRSQFSSGASDLSSFINGGSGSSSSGGMGGGLGGFYKGKGN